MKNLLKIFMQLVNTNRKALVFLFVCALSFRVLLVFVHYPKNIAPDSTGYYRTAVNIVLGNGYSNQEEPPYKPFFFREPGYSYFLAGGLWVYKSFGGSLENLSFNESFVLDANIGAVLFLKLLQALIDSLSILIFYSLLRGVVKKQYSFFFTLILAFYYPIALYSTYLLREALVSFLFLIIAYSLVNYLKTEKLKYLILLSFVSACSILTFQLYGAILVFVFVFMLLNKKTFVFALKNTFISGVIISVLLVPWLFHVYSHYNDVRIVKTFGSSFTYEMISLNKQQRKAVYYELAKQEDINFQWNMPSDQQFAKSFDGTYTRQADSIRREINKSVSSDRQYKYFMNDFITKVRKTIVFNKFGPIGTKVLVKQSPLIMGSMLLITFVVGILGLFGFFFFYRKVLIISFPFIFHYFLFFILGSEYRRGLPAQSFVLFFACLVLLYFYLRVFQKKSKQDIFNMLFI